MELDMTVSSTKQPFLHSYSYVAAYIYLSIGSIPVNRFTSLLLHGVLLCMQNFDKMLDYFHILHHSITAIKDNLKQK